VLTEGNTHVGQPSFALPLLCDMYNQNNFYEARDIHSHYHLGTELISVSHPLDRRWREDGASARNSTSVHGSNSALWSLMAVLCSTAPYRDGACCLHLQGIKCTTKWCNTPNRTHGATVLEGRNANLGQYEWNKEQIIAGLKFCTTQIQAKAELTERRKIPIITYGTILTVLRSVH